MILEVLFEVPQKIVDGLASGEYIRQGGNIVTKDGHKIVCWLKEAGSAGTQTAIINPAVAVAVASIAIGFMVLYKKMDKVEVMISRLEHSLQNIADIVEDTRLYQHTALIANLRTAIINAERGISERKEILLEDARKQFCNTGEMAFALAEMIIQRNQIIPKHEIYEQYSLLYYICSQGDVHCSMALNEFQTAKKDTERHLTDMRNLKNKFREKLLTANGNEIEILSYQEIKKLSGSRKPFDTYLEYIEGNNPVIEYLSKNTIPYIDYEESMMKLESQPEAVVCLPRMSFA